ncbi:MAG TPA: hypothetical protein VGZ00_03790 [Candidatus Baltobacteraceae bacterium]|nr:hypothetical protein [Candidatus Baltobacteraceae bacterium]
MSVVTHRNNEALALDPELPGFTLDVKDVFDLTKISRPQRSHRDAQGRPKSRRP